MKNRVLLIDQNVSDVQLLLCCLPSSSHCKLMRNSADEEDKAVVFLCVEVELCTSLLPVSSLFFGEILSWKVQLFFSGFSESYYFFFNSSKKSNCWHF